MRGLAIVVALALAGCSTATTAPSDYTGKAAPLLSQIPTETAVLAGEYQRLASCSYQRLDAAEGAGIKKIDLPTERQTKLAQESGGVRYWELIFEPTDPTHTQVRFTRVNTMWGPLGGQEIMPQVKACANT
jgi:hypothetical protein